MGRIYNDLRIRNENNIETRGRQQAREIFERYGSYRRPSRSTRYKKKKKIMNAEITKMSFHQFNNSISYTGANFFPKRIPSRIALLQILVFNWIMYNYYSASIVSARLSEPLDMMEDSVTVLADSNLKIAAEAVPYLNYFLYVRVFPDTLRSLRRQPRYTLRKRMLARCPIR